jgi:hypothetical protein
MNRQRKRRKLTASELRAIQATPGLIVQKVSPDGRSRLEQLTAEASGSEARRPSPFYAKSETEGDK